MGDVCVGMSMVCVWGVCGVCVGCRSFSCFTAKVQMLSASHVYMLYCSCLVVSTVPLAPFLASQNSGHFLWRGYRGFFYISV